MTGFNQNVDLDIGELLKQSWNIFQRDIVNWILITIVGALALGVGGWGGYQHCALKAARGEEVKVGDVLYPFQNLSLFIPVLAIIGISIVTCGIGGIVVAFLWFWLYPLMIDRNMSFGDAARLSKDAAMANVGPTIITLVAMIAINSIGSSIAIGSLLTTPFTSIMAILAFHQIFSGQPTPQQLDYAPGAPAPMGAPRAPQGAPLSAPPMGAPPAAAPMGAPPMAAPPAAAPMGAPPMGAPPAAAPTAPAPAPASTAPAPAPAPTAPAPAPAPNVVETAQQSTTNDPDEVHRGKTIAMSSIDFENMLKNPDGDS